MYCPTHVLRDNIHDIHKLLHVSAAKCLLQGVIKKCKNQSAKTSVRPTLLYVLSNYVKYIYWQLICSLFCNFSLKMVPRCRNV
jgi:hypothetical protein